MKSILKRISVLLFITTVPTLYSETSESNSEPSPQEQILPEVVVTATRSQTPLSKTASTVTVISQEEIQSKQYRTVADAIRSIPGVTIVQPGTPGQQVSLLFRGTESRHNRILIDGRPIPEAIGGSIAQDISLANVERIEVMQGPASSLYGSNAIGGVINLITKKGKDLEKPESSLEFEAGSFNNFREAARSRGAFGLFDYSVEASRQDADFQRANNELRDSRWRGTFGYQFTPDLYFDLATDYSLMDVGSPGADPTSSFSKPGNTITF